VREAHFADEDRPPVAAAGVLVDDPGTAELVGELGGIGALRASGAFHEVDELGYGAAWLQAIAELGDYDEAAARRVFDVLAPVLIGGMAQRSFSKFHAPLAYDVNADDYRRENA
jgi:hypothetical protein